MSVFAGRSRPGICAGIFDIQITRRGQFAAIHSEVIGKADAEFHLQLVLRLLPMVLIASLGSALLFPDLVCPHTDALKVWRSAGSPARCATRIRSHRSASICRLKECTGRLTYTPSS